MKNWLILVFLILSSCRQKKESKIEENAAKQSSSANVEQGFKSAGSGIVQYPKAKGYVNDFAHIFSTAEISYLDSIISLHEKETTNQIAVVTFDTVKIPKEEFDAYTLGLANHWGVGQKKRTMAF